LADATFDWIDANLKDSIDFVIWTGDSARHDSDETISRTQQEVESSNRMLVNKFVHTLSDSTGLTIPVIPTFGNNDILPHNIMEGGPNKWLKLYADIWKDFIPEAQRHTFELGGWFFTEVVPNKLAVFSLNTLYFFDRNAGIDDCVHPSEPGFKQMEWLRIQLQFLRNRGMKAILMGHVPPARTAGKQNWDETCWQKYTLWLQQYRDVIVGSIYGHMNIDHFFLQDTKDINLAVFEKGTREYEEHIESGKHKKHREELSVQSSADYLADLRDDWAKLPKAAVRTSSKGKKDTVGGEWAERYQLSFVSPSIVPNYFPTIRVFEYNITGLENAKTWVDWTRDRDDDNGDSERVAPLGDEEDPEKSLELRDIEPEFDIEGKKHKKKKGKKGKKEKKPKDPYLIIPDPPAKTTPPGPGYSPQPLTLTGYIQYFANLTYINNDAANFVESHDTDDRLFANRWNEGVHKGKKPKHSPRPHDFEFQVEYSTFHDKIYKLDDLTVSSFVDLAYRIGRMATSSAALADDSENEENEEEESEVGVDDDVEDDDDEGGNDYAGDDAEASKKGKNKKDKDKKKKKKKEKKQNNLWLHFLGHAFVSTVPKDKLKEM
jgi:endopolyphosphatase